jgi:hypothetical protein
VTDEILARVAKVYEGSDGDATMALYKELTALGPIGVIATNLFRATKNSERAKKYRGGGYKGMAYDRKQWAMGNLATALTDHAKACGIGWGWGIDAAQSFHNVVLYIDTPGGQVSFHTETRGIGPDYPGAWDGQRGMSAARTVQFAASVLAAAAVASDA